MSEEDFGEECHGRFGKHCQKNFGARSAAQSCMNLKPSCDDFLPVYGYFAA